MDANTNWKIEVRIYIPAIQQIHNEQDKLGNLKKVPKFDVVFWLQKVVAGIEYYCLHFVMKLALLVVKSETTYLNACYCFFLLPLL